MVTLASRRAPRSISVGLAALLTLTACTAFPPDDQATPATTATATATPGTDTDTSDTPEVSMEMPEPDATPTPTPTPTGPAPTVPDASPWIAPAPVPADDAQPWTGDDVDTVIDLTDEDLETGIHAHDDVVTMFTNDIGELDFTYTDSSVTKDQPFSFTGSDSSAHELDIKVSAGHKNSSTPADWFTDRVGTNTTNADPGLHGYTGRSPDDLHYAFCGELTFTTYGGTTTACFGQGHTAFDNNWWFGGSDFTVHKDQLCYIDPLAANDVDQGLAACVLAGSTSNEFTVVEGLTHANYVTTYSPKLDTALSESIETRTVAQNLVDSLYEKDLISKTEKTALDVAIRALPDTTITAELPTGWTFHCDDACANEDQYAISDGQIWAGARASDAYSSWLWADVLPSDLKKDLNNTSINATAGRHGTTDVAEWMTDQVGDGGMIGMGSGNGTKTPGSLNFAFCGTLDPDGVDSHVDHNVCLGQGHTVADDANNWWVGGEDWIDVGSMSTQDALQIIHKDWLRHLIEFASEGGEVRMLLHRESLTAIITMETNASDSIFVDNMMIVAGVEVFAERD
ncbi:hypothetical protein R2Q81_02765 [Microbacterium aquimaris]|uniref:hypothetical protein n=1 Tax=Microbacterium aquimaris TaxID=459816 RepID=UPI002AD2621C|nr:hypothetical protein [Microbacterium aquimaris]MDZ8274863.1 hypothetical protein [Microbacterium aquimaris]